MTSIIGTMSITQGGVTEYKNVSTDKEQAQMSAVTQQPVYIDIEADHSTF